MNFKVGANLCVRPIRTVVLGLGRAGKSRVKALQEHPAFDYVGTISRRAEFSDLNLSDLKQRSDIDLAVISTENAAHFEQVKTCLQSGLDVIVDFPLASTFEQAEELVNLAQKQKKLLHVEFIGLMTQKHLAHKKEIQKHKIESVSMIFEGSFEAWFAEEAQKHPASLLVGRLQMLWDLFGPLNVVDCQGQINSEQMLLDIKLESHEFIPISFKVKRQQGLARNIRLEIGLEIRPEIPQDFQKNSQEKSLFYRDLDLLLQIKEGQKPLVSLDDVLAVQRLAEEITLTL